MTIKNTRIDPYIVTRPTYAFPTVGIFQPKQRHEQTLVIGTDRPIEVTIYKIEEHACKNTVNIQR